MIHAMSPKSPQRIAGHVLTEREREVIRHIRAALCKVRSITVDALFPGYRNNDRRQIAHRLASMRVLEFFAIELEGEWLSAR